MATAAACSRSTSLPPTQRVQSGDANELQRQADCDVFVSAAVDVDVDVEADVEADAASKAQRSCAMLPLMLLLLGGCGCGARHLVQTVGADRANDRMDGRQQWPPNRCIRGAAIIDRSVGGLNRPASRPLAACFSPVQCSGGHDFFQLAAAAAAEI